MHPVVLTIVYLAIAVAPLVLSALQGLPSRSFLDEVATGLGMTAFAILLVEFVLSGRFRLISGGVGLDVTMRFHQLLARTMLVFVLVHPFLYQAAYNPPLPWDPSRELTLGLGADSLITGVIAWIALPGFVLMSIFRDRIPYSYETWRIMHAGGAVIIAAMVTHHALEAGRYSADPLLAGFWILLLVIALASVVWTYVISPLGEAGRPYEVTSVRKIALKTWEVTVRPERGDALDFKAGQFVWLTIGHGRFSVHENPFSISSAPAARPDVQFVIKEIGDMTRAVGGVKPGTRAYLDGPHGNITLKGRSGKGIALIAGGVGIAPLIGIARQLKADDDPRSVVLLYGNRVAEQIVYPEELAELDQDPRMKVVHVISEPEADWDGLTGQIDGPTIERVFSFDGASEWLYLVCGPPAMLDGVEDALVALGVPPRQIVSERFHYT